MRYALPVVGLVLAASAACGLRFAMAALKTPAIT